MYAYRPGYSFDCFTLLVFEHYVDVWNFCS